MDFIDNISPKLLMFCGKGGVGKTSMAASTAFHMVKRGKKTLLISSDPSPSISDILEQNVLGKITEIESVPNLSATELDYNVICELSALNGDGIEEMLRAVERVVFEGGGR